jgi:hypothetical protein
LHLCRGATIIVRPQQQIASLIAALLHSRSSRNTSNEASLINYGERYRSGERISSAFVEATVNAVVSKRFAKKQQMQWSRRGAHLLLQTRTRALDGSLRAAFEHWYPGLMNDNVSRDSQAAA